MGRTKLEDPTRYAEPDGSNGSIRWSLDQQDTLKRLSSDGTVKTGTEALHRNLSPDLDSKGMSRPRQVGLRFTKAMRDRLAEAEKNGAIPPPHPLRNQPTTPREGLATRSNLPVGPSVVDKLHRIEHERVGAEWRAAHAAAVQQRDQITSALAGLPFGHPDRSALLASLRESEKHEERTRVQLSVWEEWDGILHRRASDYDAILAL